MKKRFVIGYILLNIGIIIGAISVIINLIQNIILKFYPEAFYTGVFIGTGFTWLLFIIPGSILVRKHEQLFKTIIGTIITLLGIILILVAVSLSGEDAVLLILPLVLLYLTPGILLISNIKSLFIIGYEFLISGIIGAIVLAFIYINTLLSPPAGGDLIGAALGAGFAFLFYTGWSIVIILCSIMVIEHRFFVKKLFAIIVILLGIIPQIVVFVGLLAERLREFERWGGRLSARPIGPEPELLIFFMLGDEMRVPLLLIPFVLYLIPVILLLKSSKQNRSG
jgi:hypothetical protein